MTNIDLEKYVIASLLRSHHQQLAYMLQPDDFSDAGNRAVYKLMHERIEKGIRVDSTLLDDPCLLEDVHECTLLALSDALSFNTTDDAALLREKIDQLANLSDLNYAKRNAVKLIDVITSKKIKNVSNAIDFLANICDDLMVRHPREFDITLGTSVLSGLNRVEKMKRVKKLKTGINDIDQFLFGGIGQGELVVFAARPNLGKSIFALAPAIEAAKNGVSTLFAINEMDKEQTSIRMLANMSGVDINAIEGNVPFSEGDCEALAIAVNTMRSMPLTFLENAYKVEDIERILKTREKLRKPIRLVIVDMAGRMKTSEKKSTDREDINEVSRHLFSLTKKYRCTIIGTVQINRAGANSYEPNLKHLKESGRWEEDPDKVFMMWADKTDDEQRIIALRKNRTGPNEEKFFVRLDGCHMRLK